MKDRGLPARVLQLGPIVYLLISPMSAKVRLMFGCPNVTVYYKLSMQKLIRLALFEAKFPKTFGHYPSTHRFYSKISLLCGRFRLRFTLIIKRPIPWLYFLILKANIFRIFFLVKYHMMPNDGFAN